ncbi:nose resistant to fluoxetine protein 6-like [Episyrphus balteatus]|uniref:nose resistant to fluoxetine protein 6-like n=1 Tax=Episyrphus balteatus TaxID=286459 RepID=UPI0024858554|nr:nose resistant to fluoxetine protein 6-like [Episyrphus balteatus]
MVNMLCSLNIFISFLLISGINSILIVKNVTVHSDFLREAFLNEIRSNSEFAEIGGENLNQYDSKKCIQSLRELTKVGSSQGVRFFDSWGKIPSGIKSFNLYDVGLFDQCIETSVPLSDLSIDEVSGQFCFAELPLTNATLMNDEVKSFLKANIGICVPNSCSPEIITEILKKSLLTSSNGVLSDVTVTQCTNGKRPPLKVIHVIGIFVFSMVLALMVASTGYEFYINNTGKKPIPVLLAFSILTNGRKLFAINTTKSPNSIDCLTGLRVLSMLWIIDHHTHYIQSFIPALNQIMYKTYMKDSIWSLHCLNAPIAVDTFFFISGLLVAWAGFKGLDITNGKMNVVMMYVHRYIRLTPAVAAVLLFNYSLNEYIFIGPFREAMLKNNRCDSKNWLSILLYIQNYIEKTNNCLDETWYLAVDFHLYLISPLLLIMMWKYGKKFAPVLLVLALSSIAYVISAFIKMGFTGLVLGTNWGDWWVTNIPTHARIAAWLVGFALGYFMHVNRHKTFNIPKPLQILGWIVSFLTMFFIVFGVYYIMDENGRSTNLVAALNEGLKRVSWATAIAWITFACHNGFGGVVNSFLSHPLWQPLARLSYCLFLIHMTVMRINLGSYRTQIYVSEFVTILNFWSAFGQSLFFAIFLTLGFELPITVLEKFIFYKEKTVEKKEK